MTIHSCQYQPIHTLYVLRLLRQFNFIHSYRAVFFIYSSILVLFLLDSIVRVLPRPTRVIHAFTTQLIKIFLSLFCATESTFCSTRHYIYIRNERYDIWFIIIIHSAEHTEQFGIDDDEGDGGEDNGNWWSGVCVCVFLSFFDIFYFHFASVFYYEFCIRRIANHRVKASHKFSVYSLYAYRFEFTRASYNLCRILIHPYLGLNSTLYSFQRKNEISSALLRNTSIVTTKNRCRAANEAIYKKKKKNSINSKWMIQTTLTRAKNQSKQNKKFRRFRMRSEKNISFAPIVLTGKEM